MGIEFLRLIFPKLRQQKRRKTSRKEKAPQQVGKPHQQGRVLKIPHGLLQLDDTQLSYRASR